VPGEVIGLLGERGGQDDGDPGADHDLCAGQREFCRGRDPVHEAERDTATDWSAAGKRGLSASPVGRSAERTLAVPPIAADSTASLTWTVKTVLEGDVAAYVVVLPAPPNAGGGEPAGDQPGYSDARGRAPCIEPGRCVADGGGRPAAAFASVWRAKGRSPLRLTLTVFGLVLP